SAAETAPITPARPERAKTRSSLVSRRRLNARPSRLHCYDQRSRLTIRRSSSLVKIETHTLSGCHAVPNTIRNPYAAISRPSQKNAWQMFKSPADCRQPVEVPHLILGHGPRPAVDSRQQRGPVHPEYLAQLRAD